MEISYGTRDGGPVVLLQVPSGGPEVTLDPAGWARLQAAGVTSVCVKRGGHVVARLGTRQTPAARLVFGDAPPGRITYANGDRRDLRWANLAAKGGGRTKRAPSNASRSCHPDGELAAASEATAWAKLPPLARAAAIRAMLRQCHREAWHARIAWEMHQGSYPLTPLLFPRRPPGARR